MNYLKIKSSYGELGNNKTLDVNGNPTYFPYIQGFEVGWNNLDQSGVILGSAVDSNLRWEKTSSFNVGAEIGLFKNRITVNFDYFQKKSVDLIYDLYKQLNCHNYSLIQFYIFYPAHYIWINCLMMV